MAGGSCFLLSEYLTLFLHRIGEHVTAFQYIGEQQLLPYQCAIQRDEWNRVQAHFHRAYSLQKAAYRHSRGGPTAPGVCENHDPRFGKNHNPAPTRQRVHAVKTVVRNTFIELDEPTAVEGACKRCRTHSPVRRLG